MVLKISNFKSSDAVYFGPIKSIDVTSIGDGQYDVINPPILQITDTEPSAGVGFGTDAEGVCNVTGSLSRINILNKGFDYADDPKVTISGGNEMVPLQNVIFQKLLTLTTSMLVAYIKMLTYKIIQLVLERTTGLEILKEVVYNSQDQQQIGGLVNSAIYYVNNVDLRTVKLHPTLEDAISGINTVDFTSYGEGLQRIQSFDKKNVISSIEVENGGSGYENKTLFFNEDNVDQFDNKIVYEDHGYTEKQVILFNSEGTLPVGLSTTTEYHVNVIDKDSFRIAAIRNVGTGDTLPSDYNYVNRRFIDFSDGGTGQHTVKYQPITVKVEAPIGITTVGSQDFSVKIDPVFTGEITSVSMKSHGSNYGTPDILNYKRQPDFSLINGSGAQLTPIVSSFGELIGVIVNNGGENYNSPPIIEVLGEGGGVCGNTSR